MKKIITLLIVCMSCFILTACFNDDIPEDIGVKEKATIKDSNDNMYNDYVFDGENEDLMEEDFED